MCFIPLQGSCCTRFYGVEATHQTNRRLCHPIAQSWHPTPSQRFPRPPPPDRRPYHNLPGAPPSGPKMTTPRGSRRRDATAAARSDKADLGFSPGNQRMEERTSSRQHRPRLSPGPQPATAPVNIVEAARHRTGPVNNALGISQELAIVLSL